MGKTLTSACGPDWSLEAEVLTGLNPNRINEESESTLGSLLLHPRLGRYDRSLILALMLFFVFRFHFKIDYGELCFTEVR